MGKNNRQRRAAKQRKRDDRRRRQRSGGDTGGWSSRRSDDVFEMGPMTMFMAAVHAEHTGDDDIVDSFVDRLAALPRAPLAREVQQLLEQQVSNLWTGGWQPAVLVHVTERELGRGETALLRSAVADESRAYEVLGREVAPEWMGQLDAVEATRWWRDDRPWLLQLPHSWPAVLVRAVRLMNLLGRLPALPVLSPPPAQWHRGMQVAAPSNLPAGLLEKVRGLLAKAESTTFDGEAEAFTAKAQELMARHRIDRAVLESSGAGSDDEPVGRRLLIDDPYAEAKAMLLDAISRANGGHSVWSKGMACSTVFAFADELDVIEDLYTSLLVQATAALQREGSKQDRYGRSRTTRFRRSFLLAFAGRIGRRLQEVVDTTVADAEAESGAAFLPVLASQSERAREAAEEAFPDVRSVSASITDREGWYAGTIFGDQADLAVGAPVERRAG